MYASISRWCSRLAEHCTGAEVLKAEIPARTKTPSSIILMTFYSTVPLQLCVETMAPFLFFKPRKHLKDDTSVKSNTIIPSFTQDIWRVAARTLSSVHIKKRSCTLFMQLSGFGCTGATGPLTYLTFLPVPLLLPEKTQMERGFGREKHGCNIPWTCKQCWQAQVFNNLITNTFSMI